MGAGPKPILYGLVKPVFERTFSEDTEAKLTLRWVSRSPRPTPPLFTAMLYRPLAPCFALFLAHGVSAFAAAEPTVAPSALFPADAVVVTGGPFRVAQEANRTYLLAHDVKRLLAPFRREAGLPMIRPPYPDWESQGLDGHTAGHYLSALAGMIAEGADTPDGQLRQRLSAMIDGLAECQAASGDGYLGGVPGGHAMWKDVAAGKLTVNNFGLNGKWVPWYNLHKMFAGLRDAYQVGGEKKALPLFVAYGRWCERTVAGLSEAQMQDMLRAEHGGMVEVLADLYSLTGDEAFLKLSQRFVHHAVIDPLAHHEDRLTGLHANTQIPKIIGVLRLGQLSHQPQLTDAARFFWDTVTQHRTVAFGGNSVSEHFNDPKNFRGMLEHREGPETCNTYNMLRLTEQLFEVKPDPVLADYYERALYNHILGSFNTAKPGYVYFTPIRPGHYRVTSVPEKHFWCCVGTGMENPGHYSHFIYAGAGDQVFVNLFIPSELKAPQLGLCLRQETAFPDEERTRLLITLEQPKEFTLHVRRPSWADGSTWQVTVNGETVATDAKPSSYVALRRLWKSGDRVEMVLPMRTRTEELPDRSGWLAFMHGPLLLAAPVASPEPLVTDSGEGRSAHIAKGPLLPLDQMPFLLDDGSAPAGHVKAEPAAGPLHFRLKELVRPETTEGLALVPFFRLQDSRYQIYFQSTTPEALAKRREQLAAEERAALAREAATVDRVAIGEQQPEVDHEFQGRQTESGEFNGRRWRHGQMIQYTLQAGAARALELSVTYSGYDRDRTFDIFVNDQLLHTEALKGERPGEFVERRYHLPAELLKNAVSGRLVVRFEARPGSLAGGLFDLRLLKAE